MAPNLLAKRAGKPPLTRAEFLVIKDSWPLILRPEHWCQLYNISLLTFYNEIRYPIMQTIYAEGISQMKWSCFPRFMQEMLQCLWVPHIETILTRVPFLTKIESSEQYFREDGLIFVAVSRYELQCLVYRYVQALRSWLEGNQRSGADLDALVGPLNGIDIDDEKAALANLESLLEGIEL